MMSSAMNRREGFMLVFCLGGSILNTTISLMTTHDNDNEQRQVDNSDNKKKMTRLGRASAAMKMRGGFMIVFY